jgi:hypothetical protein
MIQIFSGQKDNTHRIQVSQDGDDEQGHSVDETHENQPEKTDSLFMRKLTVSLVHVIPDLSRNFEFFC